MPEIIIVENDKQIDEDMATLYNLVWNIQDSETIERMRRHATYDGYLMFVAYDNKELIGFVYAYQSIEGQFYNGLLRNAMKQEKSAFWLEDCLEIVELVVHPSYRRKKVGLKLLKKLLNHNKYRTAILTTQASNQLAISLYKRLDFNIINDAFYPEKEGQAYVIMGRKFN